MKAEKIIMSIVSFSLILSGVFFFVTSNKTQTTNQQATNKQISDDHKGVLACTTSPSDVIFVIDQSSSVLIGGTNSGRTAMLNFIDQLGTRNPQNRIGVVTFTIQDQTDVRHALSTNYASVKSSVSSLTDNDPNGPSSCIECGVRMANSEILNEGESGHRKVIVLLTDGAANRTKSGSKDEGVAVDLAEDAAKDGFAQSGTIFYTVGIGDDKNATLLLDIARATGGRFYDSSSNADLNAIFGQVAGEVSCSGGGSAPTPTLAPGVPTRTPTPTLPAGVPTPTPTRPAAPTPTNPPPPPPTYAIRGTVFNDTNRNGIQETGEADYYGARLTLSNGRNAATNSLGDYAFAGLSAGTYTVTMSPVTGYLFTTPSSVTAAITANRVINFGIAQSFSISGSVFVDANKNGRQDTGEPNYDGRPSISASRGNVTTATAGTYSVQNLAPGAVTVSQSSIPADYEVTYPLNGPPPSFQVTVGSPGCQTNGAIGATCY